MHIETQRLVLRDPRAVDTDPILVIRNSDFVMRFNAMTPWTREQVWNELAGDGEENVVIVERKEDGAVLGALFYAEDNIRYRVRSWNLSYYLGEQYARQGYMKEALRGLVDWLFAEEEGLELVSARVFSGNTGSERLLRSLGFHHEGTVRRGVRNQAGEVFDDLLFSLLREEWLCATRIAVKGEAGSGR